MKTILTILLCSSLAVNAPAQQRRSAAGIAVGVGLICGGVVCTIILAKKCAKWFPKAKPANTNEFWFVQPDPTDEYGASWNYGALGSCMPDLQFVSTGLNGAEIPENPTTFVLNIEVLPGPKLQIGMHATRTADAFQDWYGLQNDMLSHSLLISGIPDGSTYFERNRQPADPSDVPIRFGPEPGQVTVGEGDLVAFVVERSTDLIDWEQLLVTQYPVGQRLEILDTSTDESAFYRASVVP